MFRELAIWVYMRLVSGVFFLVTLALAGLGLTKAASDVELLRSGVRVDGVVVEMREKAPAAVSAPAPAAKSAAVPVETAKPASKPASPASAPPGAPGSRPTPRNPNRTRRKPRRARRCRLRS